MGGAVEACASRRQRRRRAKGQGRCWGEPRTVPQERDRDRYGRIASLSTSIKKNQASSLFSQQDKPRFAAASLGRVRRGTHAPTGWGGWSRIPVPPIGCLCVQRIYYLITGWWCVVPNVATEAESPSCRNTLVHEYPMVIWSFDLIKVNTWHVFPLLSRLSKTCTCHDCWKENLLIKQKGKCVRIPISSGLIWSILADLLCVEPRGRHAHKAVRSPNRPIYLLMGMGCTCTFQMPWR
jgi:hypothetical protein